MEVQCRYDIENPMVMIVVMAGGARVKRKRDSAKIFCARNKQNMPTRDARISKNEKVTFSSFHRISTSAYRYFTGGTYAL
jgi:hypothetical protein